MDNGIVLNIEEHSQSPQHVRAGSIKGGRWTDRVKAKRAIKRKAAKASSSSKGKGKEQSTGNEHYAELDCSPRPAKKARKAPPTHRQGSELTKSTRMATTPHGSQIISSLFTSNPEIKLKSSPSLLFRPAKPSNAPLTDKSTFTGLGLDALIVAHLEEKMNIIKPTSIQREALPALLSASDEGMSDRDVFIQSQTGSGKTLSYLLPILEDLLPLSSLSFIDRSIGTLAIIVAPTRELAKQISDVLEQLLSLRLRPKDSYGDDAQSKRLTRWLVAGLLIGGENRSHEKSRIRKGLPILVSTPGRLLDHLQNTSAFNAGKCRWLVLDEADRLMELGFEDTIKGILQALDGRRKLAIQAAREGKSMEVGGWDWERRRRTVLCSATIRENVQVLAGTALVKPIVVKALQDERVSADSSSQVAVVTPNLFPTEPEKFTPPSQLLQKYIIAPLKLRLVALVALLRSILAHTQGRRGTKIIVFLSCTDSVDYHWRLLGSSSIEDSAGASGDGSDAGSEEEGVDSKTKEEEENALTSSLLPQSTIYRLHGSLPLQTRLASLKGFSSNSEKKQKDNSSPKDHDPTATEQQQSNSSILLCTSVASRGLDLPLVRAVVQYDLPTEGGVTEYVHRVGRTARVGKGGEAWSFVAPSEQGWIKWMQDRMHDRTKEDAEKKTSPSYVDVQNVLRNGFGGTGNEYEDRATQVQLAFERWVIKRKDHCDMARKAFLSHVRAYATHPSDEKHMFHIRNLHLGHLAKAFALREAPGNISQNGGKKGKKEGTRAKKGKAVTRVGSSISAQINAKKGGSTASRGKDKGRREERKMPTYDMSAERRMQEVVRRQGRLVKKGGALVVTGASEFQVADSNELEQLTSLR